MKKSALSLKELASLTDSQSVGDESLTITGVASLSKAGPSDVSFLAEQPYGQNNSIYEQQMQTTTAGAVIVGKAVTLPKSGNFLIADHPSEAFQKTLEYFFDLEKSDYVSGWSETIHPSAVIHPTAKIADGVTIGPLAVIDAETVIGAHTIIGSQCYIGAQTTIGANTLLHPRVTLRERCTVGDRVIIHPGVVIGACGFGYRSNQNGHFKLRQLGTVIIEDDVEIGANSCIDRARFGETKIGRGTKIDNLVQIAHGVELGEHNMIVGQVGIAGSTTTGKRVIMAGQCAINGHIHITDDVILAARTGVMRSIDKSGKYGGAPAEPFKRYLRNIAAMSRLSEYASTLKKFLKK